MDDYICIKECYYGPPGFRRYYKPGDRLRGNIPNKHFVPASEFDPKKLNPWPRDELHNPRSTVQILSDLKHQFGVKLDPKNTSRQAAFERWRKETDKVRSNPSKNEKPSNNVAHTRKSDILTMDPSASKAF